MHVCIDIYIQENKEVKLNKANITWIKMEIDEVIQVNHGGKYGYIKATQNLNVP